MELRISSSNRNFLRKICFALLVAIFFTGCSKDFIVNDGSIRYIPDDSIFLSGLPILVIETEGLLEISTQDWHQGATYRFYYDDNG